MFSVKLFQSIMHYLVIMECLFISLLLVKTGDCCSYFSIFDYRYATTEDKYKYNYDEIKIKDTRVPEEAKEEAVMLIGGIYDVFFYGYLFLGL